MISWVKQLSQKWNDWCGDREMELAIRRQLSDDGFFGGTAKLKNVRLVAVQRPGWLQVYRFDALARVNHDADHGQVPDSGILDPEGRDPDPPDGSDRNKPDPDGPDPEAEYREVYGLVRDDIRHKISVVRAFATADERSELFADWSDGLICLRGAHGLIVSDPTSE